MGFGNNSMRYTDTQSYIRYTPRDVNVLNTGSTLDPNILGSRTGTVDMQGYLNWLRQHGYCSVGETQGSCKHSAGASP